jgi:hypothetical protein
VADHHGRRAPLPLSFGERDVVQARWSRDGERIAYVSNEFGDSALWVQEVAGGARTRVLADKAPAPLDAPLPACGCGSSQSYPVGAHDGPDHAGACFHLGSDWPCLRPGRAWPARRRWL